jgi:phosphoenolpyruvate carboxylase
MVWAMAQQNWQAYPPQVQMALAKYAPYPESVIQDIQQGYQQAMQPPPPDPRVEAEVRKIMSEIGENEAQAQKYQADAAKTAAEIRKTPVELAKMAAEAEKTNAEAFQTGAQTGDMLRRAQIEDAGLVPAGYPQ